MVCATMGIGDFLFCLFAVLRLYLVVVGTSTTRYGRGEHRSPAKKHKVTFPLSYFSVTKSTKSHLRGLFPPVSATPTNALRALVNSPLLKNSFRVHESVARAMRGECVRQGINRKSAVLPLSATSYYHACEHSARDSRADSCTHCLHAR